MINELCKKAHGQAKKSGFYDEYDCALKYRAASEALLDSLFESQKLALIHEEAAEAFTAHRKNQRDKIPEELADTVIRIMDYCGWKGIDLEQAIKEKMEKNATRPKKHGNLY